MFICTLLYLGISLVSPAALPFGLEALHLNQILGVILLLGSFRALGGSGVTNKPDLLLLLGLLFAAVFSILQTGWVGGSIDVLMNFFPVVCAFYFVAVFVRTERQFRLLALTLAISAMFIFANGVYDFFVAQTTSPFIMRERVDGGVLYRFRGLGVLSDPNDTAQFYVTIIPLLWFNWVKGNFVRNVLYVLLPACGLLTGMYFTHSRGGVLALLAVLLFGFKDKIGIVFSSVLAGLGGVGALALNFGGNRGLNEDDGDRTGLWATAMEVFRHHPVLGVGMGQFPNYNEVFLTAHDSYVLCLAELGMVGYIFWMGLIVSAWTGTTKIVNWNKAPKKEAETEAEPERSPVNVWAMPQNSFARQALLATAGPGGDTAAMESAILPSNAALPSWGGTATIPAWMVDDGDDGKELRETKLSDDQLVYFAKVLRISMVGFLCAAIFLSRTYAMTLYILLGIACALRAIFVARHPEAGIKFPVLSKKVFYAIIGSILAIYAFVRIHGHS